MSHKVNPKPIDPFNAGIVVGKLSEAIDLMLEVSVGFTPSERHNLCGKIARTAIALRTHPESEDLRREYNLLLDTYEKEFSWIDR